MRYILVSRETNLVTNAISLDPRSINYSGPTTDFGSYSAPEGFDLVPDDEGKFNIGASYPS